MLIQQKLGNIQSFEIKNRVIDPLPLEWFETNKRILHAGSVAGTKITMKFLQEDPGFTQGDIVFENEEKLIVIDIIPCEAMIIQPGSMYQMACLCYEIGNKHLPLFINDQEIMVPYEARLFQWLSAAGFNPLRENRKLLNAIKTTTMAHSHNSTGSLFSKILQLTKTSMDA